MGLYNVTYGWVNGRDTTQRRYNTIVKDLHGQRGPIPGRMKKEGRCYSLETAENETVIRPTVDR